MHLPYTYSSDDPFGTTEWRNSQTLNLLETQKGNCYALVTLFKILSERFNSEANIVTAPQHIYIEHRDPKGNMFNVEVATRSFPDIGSIQALTYTTRQALLNDIAMRSLDLKQSVGLCLVYLAKGYEYKYKTKDDEFLLTCANKALTFDPKNLNALLLKAQVYEQRVLKKQIQPAPYEKMLTEIYTLGYRQMPDDMKNIILSQMKGTAITATPTNKTPNPFEGIGEQARYVTLSNGLFEEVHTPQKIVRYGRTIFDTEKNKIVKFLDADNSSYQVDPVVFALSVDPLTKDYPSWSPYPFAMNRPIDGIDLDGLEFSQSRTIGNNGVTIIKITLRVKVSVDSKVLNKDSKTEILNRTSQIFSNSIGSVYDKKRKIQYKGELIYDNNASISLSLTDPAPEEDNIISGLSIPGAIGTKVSKYKNGTYKLKDIDEIATTNVHEFLHQGGVEHPHSRENTAQDVALEKIDPSNFREDDPDRNNKLKSKTTTKIPDIYYNIMIYGFKVVDGKKVSDVRGADKNGTKISPDQMNIIKQNIDKGKVNGEAAR